MTLVHNAHILKPAFFIYIFEWQLIHKKMKFRTIYLPCATVLMNFKFDRSTLVGIASFSSEDNMENQFYRMILSVDPTNITESESNCFICKIYIVDQTENNMCLRTFYL